MFLGKGFHQAQAVAFFDGLAFFKRQALAFGGGLIKPQCGGRNGG